MGIHELSKRPDGARAAPALDRLRVEETVRRKGEAVDRESREHKARQSELERQPPADGHEEWIKPRSVAWSKYEKTSLVARPRRKCHAQIFVARYLPRC